MNVGVPAYEQVTDIIRGQIISGEIPSDTRLTILAVAKKFGVSQMPVREAFQCLQGEGLLKVVAHKGAYVLALDPDRIRSFYLIRSVVEGLLARQSVHHMTDPILEKLKKINIQFKAAVENNNLKKITSLNKEFHKNLYRCAEIPEAFDVYERYEGLLTTLRHKYGFHRKRLEGMVVEHSVILDAISSKDGPGVENLVKIHIEKAMDDTLSFFGNEKR
jgi:DNA-binding GntR family transcriptional regulator